MVQPLLPDVILVLYRSLQICMSHLRYQPFYSVHWLVCMWIDGLTKQYYAYPNFVRAALVCLIGAPFIKESPGSCFWTGFFDLDWFAVFAHSESSSIPRLVKKLYAAQLVVYNNDDCPWFCSFAIKVTQLSALQVVRHHMLWLVVFFGWTFCLAYRRQQARRAPRKSVVGGLHRHCLYRQQCHRL